VSAVLAEIKDIVDLPEHAVTALGLLGDPRQLIAAYQVAVAWLSTLDVTILFMFALPCTYCFRSAQNSPTIMPQCSTQLSQCGGEALTGKSVEVVGKFRDLHQPVTLRLLVY
jgi:hypothetical protein